jgi:methylmalonyl-CoA mutase
LEWLALLEKDLKGKPLSDLSWQLGHEVSIDAFYHPDDELPSRNPIPHNRPANSWEIGELYEVDEVAKANQQILEGLQGGVQGIGLKLNHQLTPKDWEVLLAGVQLDLISTNLGENYPEKSPLRVLKQFFEYAQKQGFDTNQLRGSLNFDPFLDWAQPPIDDLQQALHLAIHEMPLFRVLRLNGRYYHGNVQHIGRELAMIIAKGSEYLARLSDLGFTPEQINPRLQFSISIGSSYFVEIAKLRALRILWNNVLKAYGAPLIPAEIVVSFARDAQDDNLHTNMIRAATQTMSAVIGGADRVYVLPANSALGTPTDAFTRRIARNVQHLLQLESYFDKVIDPAAGSFYIEKMTDLLAQNAWEQFQDMEKEGDFKY